MPDDASAPTNPRILIVGPDAVQNSAVQTALEAVGYTTYVRDDPQHAFDVIYNEPPNAIILSHSTVGLSASTFATDLKNDNVFSHLPLVLLLPADLAAADIDWANLPVDDYVTLPLDSDALIRRLAFTLSRVQRELGSNPLTRLPGNESIITEVQRRIAKREEFAFAYVDVDNFKAFNDTYGFSRGDEVLRMVARVLVNGIRPLRDRGGYVGHVGGDDFVLILPASDAEGTCAQVLGNFDLIVPTFYNEADRTRGYIDAKDRQGRPTRFPLMSLTIAVVPNTGARLSHYGEAAAIAAELKKRGKLEKGSICVVDRRSAPYADLPAAADVIERS